MILDRRWPYCDLLLPAYFRNGVAEIGISPARVQDDETAQSRRNSAVLGQMRLPVALGLLRVCRGYLHSSANPVGAC